MWTKTLKIKYNRKEYLVLLVFTGEDDNKNMVVEIRSMANELFLIDEIRFKNEFAALEFIKHYTEGQAYDFFYRLSNEVGAFEN